MKVTNEQARAVIEECFPGLTDKEATVLLWECTAFPCVDAEHVLRQVREISAKSGKSLPKALEISYREMDEAMATRRNEVEDG